MKMQFFQFVSVNLFTCLCVILVCLLLYLQTKLSSAECRKAALEVKHCCQEEV